MLLTSSLEKLHTTGRLKNMRIT